MTAQNKAQNSLVTEVTTEDMFEYYGYTIDPNDPSMFNSKEEVDAYLKGTTTNEG